MSSDSKKAKDASNAKGVGYKSPPKPSQFKKGRSGNPGGRPRIDSKKYIVSDPDEVLAEVLAELVPISINGKKKRVPKHKVVVTQWVNKAMSGDMAAIKFVMQRYYRLSGQYKDPEMRFFKHTREDDAMLEQFMDHTNEFLQAERKLQEEAKKANKPPPTSHEIFQHLESKGLIKTNEEALKPFP